MYKEAIIFIDSNEQDLYLNLAGVPLINRLLLSAQKLGINNFLIIYDPSKKKIIEFVERDKRLQASLFWIEREKVGEYKETIETKIKEGIFLLPQYLLDPLVLPFLCGEKLSPQEKKLLFSLLERNKEIFRKSFKKTECRFLPRVKNDVKQTEKIIYASLNNPIHGIMEKWVDRRISFFLTRLLLKTPITPNQVTLFSLLLGFSSLFFFAQGEYKSNIIGSFIFIFSVILDSTDGELARLKFLESKLGSFLDFIGDNLVQIPLFFIIGWTKYRYTGQVYLLTAGILAAGGSFLCFISLLSFSSETEKRNFSFLKRLEPLINRDFAYLILFCALINHLELFLIITALGSNFFWPFILLKKRCPSRNTGEIIK